MKNKVLSKGLSAIAESDAKVLVLGTLPGDLSIQLNQYYAHPRNQFWKIMEAFVAGISTAIYSEKEKLLKEAGIAVWDVMQATIRTGSLDSNIVVRTNSCNDFRTFFNESSNLRAVFFNGQEAYKLFHDNIMETLPLKIRKYLAFIPLTSSSGANCRLLSEKTANWSVINHFLPSRNIDTKLK